MKQKQKKTTEKPTIKTVKKAILTELDKKKVNKDWIKSHLIISGI